MTILIVEDGTGVPGANTYASLDDCNAYCDTKGLLFGASPSLLGEQALIRATASLDGKYRAKYPGYRTIGRGQSLEWPRTAAYDYEGIVINTNAIPVEIINALCEMAVRELAEPGSLSPDLDRGGSIQSIKAGSVSINYGATATATTTYLVVQEILSGLIGPVESPYAASAGRS